MPVAEVSKIVASIDPFRELIHIATATDQQRQIELQKRHPWSDLLVVMEVVEALVVEGVHLLWIMEQDDIDDEFQLMLPPTST